MILLVDNYDSFTYNLYQYLAEVKGVDAVRVVRNDAFDMTEKWLDDVEALVVSPGPGRPSGAGRTLEAIKRFMSSKPVLGVCLGHQAIGEAYGAKVVHASSLMHGKTSKMTHDGKGLFEGMPSPLTVMRYHSLTLDTGSIPDCFEISARADDGEVMAIRHREDMVEGLQFHPESIATEKGKEMVQRFVEWGGA